MKIQPSVWPTSMYAYSHKNNVNVCGSLSWGVLDTSFLSQLKSSSNLNCQLQFINSTGMFSSIVTKTYTVRGLSLAKRPSDVNFEQVFVTCAISLSEAFACKGSFRITLE